MSEYTPTTENIRQTFAYVRAGLDHDDGYPFVMEFHVEAFDRWLASVKAEAWDEGWMHDADYVNTWGQFCPHKECNPYREPRQTPE